MDPNSLTPVLLAVAALLGAGGLGGIYRARMERTGVLVKTYNEAMEGFREQIAHLNERYERCEGEHASTREDLRATREELAEVRRQLAELLEGPGRT